MITSLVGVGENGDQSQKLKLPMTSSHSFFFFHLIFEIPGHYNIYKLFLSNYVLSYFPFFDINSPFKSLSKIGL